MAIIYLLKINDSIDLMVFLTSSRNSANIVFFFAETISELPDKTSRWKNI